MPATGYIQARAYSSYALIPLKDVAISVTASDGTAIALTLTDRNGKTKPIAIPVPDFAESQTPESEEKPFATLTLSAQVRGYEQIQSENVQVFANTVTLQNFEMIPLAEYPTAWNQRETFDTPPQNL